MKKKVLMVAVLLLFASMGVLATPIGACPTETTTSGGFSNYLTPGFSCTIGDKTFSDFTYTGSGSLGLTAAELAVTPVSSGGEYGFDFTAAWNTYYGFTSDSLIGYDVTAGSGYLITDASLSMGGYFASGIAQVSVADNFNNGVNLGVFYNPFCAATDTCITSDSTTFTGVTTLGVMKDIALSSGEGGSGALSLVSNTVSQSVPEPATLSMLGVGLIGLGSLVRRKLRA